MTKARTSLWASLAIAASVGLAGCGGSSDNDDTGATTPATPATPAPPVALTLPVGNNIRDRIDQDDESQTDGFLDGKSLSVPAGAGIPGSGVDPIDYGGVRFTCPEGGPVCTVTFTVNLNSVTATSGGAGSGLAQAVLLSTVGTGVRLATLREEIVKGPSASPNKRSRDLGFPQADTTRAGTTAFVSRHLKDPKGFTKGSHAAASGKDAWKGGPWESEAWENTAANEILIRFDNQAPGMTFAKKYGLDVGSSDDVGIVEFGATAVAQQAFWDLVRTTSDTGRVGTGPVPVTPAQGTGVPAFEISITFDGVSGTLECAVCTNLTDEAGKLASTDTTGWTFTADDSADTVTGVGTQDDYLAFGWWRKANSSGGGFAAFEPVYGGRVPFATRLDSSNVLQNAQTLRGTATYEGGAAGNYTDYSGRKAPGTNPAASGDDPADRPDRHGGWFVADAKLTAQFGQAGTAVAPDKDDRITGTISNFIGAHGRLGEWEVKLGTTANTRNLYTTGGADTGEALMLTRTDAGAGPDAENNAVTGNADGTNWHGDWGANFYGESDGDKLPSGVAGWFHASTGGTPTSPGDGTTGVAVQGSFAATRQP